MRAVLRTLLGGLVGFALVGGLAGCAAVKPWEREILARPDMALASDPLRAQLQNHIHFSKEGALPVGGGGGGGCGCN
jgi:hypothetical protein